MRNLTFWLIPLAVFLAIIFIYNSCVRNQKMNKLKSENQLLQLSIAEYATRPPKIDTVIIREKDSVKVVVPIPKNITYDSNVDRLLMLINDSIKKDSAIIKLRNILATRTYIDSVKSKDLTLFYKIKTRGEMLAYDFNYELNKPVVTIEKTLPIYTSTPVRKSKGRIYFGIGWVFSEPSASIKFDWVHKSDRWGLYYVNIPVNNIHTAGVTFKIR